MKNQSFKDYLQERHFSKESIDNTRRSVKRYRKWLHQQNRTVYNADHQIAIYYVEHLRTHHKLQDVTINLKLAHLRRYYNYLSTTKNPFRNLYVRGVKRTLYKGSLTPNELQQLYLDLEEHTALERRAKLLAGLYIFQGISTRDIKALKVANVDQAVSKLFLPMTKRSNERTLPIEPVQKDLLVRSIRDKKTETFLWQIGGQARTVAPVLLHLRKVLRKHGVKQLSELRHSVIMNWLSQHNLREVQYMAGHRYITSTEKYLKQDVSILQEFVLLHHPLNNLSS